MNINPEIARILARIVGYSYVGHTWEDLTDKEKLFIPSPEKLALLNNWAAGVVQDDEWRCPDCGNPRGRHTVECSLL